MAQHVMVMRLCSQVSSVPFDVKQTRVPIEMCVTISDMTSGVHAKYHICFQISKYPVHAVLVWCLTPHQPVRQVRLGGLASDSATETRTCDSKLCDSVELIMSFFCFQVNLFTPARIQRSNPFIKHMWSSLLIMGKYYSPGDNCCTVSSATLEGAL